MKFQSLLFIIIISYSCISCFNAPEYSDAPNIVVQEIQKTRSVPLPGDSVIVVLYFEDGNGDLGKLSNEDTIPNLFITDKRFGLVDSLSYSIPNIPKYGSVPDVSGKVSINLLAKIYCNPLFPEKTKDTLEFEFQVRDRAGNFSNIVTTGPIEIQCQ